jgi:pantoate kinase
VKAAATAFAPGHVTGFFQIVDGGDDPAQAGSRGAGFSLDRGVTSHVVVDDESMPGVTVTHDGRPAEANTTRRAVELLLARRPLHVLVEQRAALPESSAALALAEVLQRPRADAVWAAHCAEVLQRTGLGDVVGAEAGGFEVRIQPGCPPHGLVQRWSTSTPTVLLAAVGPPIRTGHVLGDAARRADIIARGGAIVDAFAPDPTLPRFLEASRRFAVECGLETAAVREARNLLGDSAAAGQAQLGNSVFVLDFTDEQARALAAHGTMIQARVDADGARVIAPRRSVA